MITDIQIEINSLKTQIDEINTFQNWDFAKKFTNPYEAIHYIPTKHTGVALIRPISRAFFKMREILDEFAHIFEIYRYRQINTLHLAEGPGGFIECIIRIGNFNIDKVWAITLINEKDTSVPGWNRSQKFLAKYPINISTGADGTGNLYNVENTHYLQNEIGGNIADIITADGGFDFSDDFIAQETMIYPLLAAEIYAAINTQANHGTLIIKFFDCFTSETHTLIHILSTLYREIHIFKPQSSRLPNSERYIIASGFNQYHEKINIFREYLHNIISNISSSTDTITTSPKSTELLESPSVEIMKYINHRNKTLGELQCIGLRRGIKFVKKLNEYYCTGILPRRELRYYIASQILMSIGWCCRYNIPINNIYNRFIENAINYANNYNVSDEDNNIGKYVSKDFADYVDEIIDILCDDVLLYRMRVAKKIDVCDIIMTMMRSDMGLPPGLESFALLKMVKRCEIGIEKNCDEDENSGDGNMTNNGSAAIINE